MHGQTNLGLAAVAFISPQNHPILVRAFSSSPDDPLKFHYLAHISLAVIDERGKPGPDPSSIKQLRAPYPPQSPRRPKCPPRATSASCTRSRRSPCTGTSRRSSSRSCSRSRSPTPSCVMPPSSPCALFSPSSSLP